MTAQEQVEAIIILMNPEAAGTQDAVFLVQKFITNTNAKISGLQKQVAILEATLEEKTQEVHEVTNAKLDSETRLKKEKDDIIAAADTPVLAQQGEVAKDPGVVKGRTL